MPSHESYAASGRRIDYLVLLIWLGLISVSVTFWVGVITLARWAL